MNSTTRKLTAALAALLMATSLWAAPGFIRAVFSHPNSGYDGDSDIWTADNTMVVTQPDLYGTTMPEHTTYAFAAYMWMEADTAYFFKGQYDDYFSVKIDEKMVVPKPSGECKEAGGAVTFPTSVWHKIEIRCANNSGAGGIKTSYPYGGVWMRVGADGAYTTILDPGDGSLFRTDAPDGYKDYTAPETDFTFNFNGDYESFTLVSASREKKVIVVPDAYCGLPVTAIGDYAFQYNAVVQKIVLPDTITRFGQYAFSSCSTLSSINIPENVTVIPDRCFFKCSSLRTIELPSCLLRIGDHAFSGCSSLASLVIGNNISIIEHAAFENCSGLMSVTIPNSVRSIDSWAFKGCSSLISLTIPDSVTSIGGYAFNSCSGLTSVIIPDSVTIIGENAFSGCSGLASVTIPDSVTSIGNSSFSSVKRVVFLGRPPSGLATAGLAFVCYPREYGDLWAAQIPVSKFGGFVKPDKPVVEIISSAVRANDPTVLDVVYKVSSAKPTVKVRALAFEDGVRSLAKVTRPETFIDGTAANIGDHVAANVEHTISWRVSSDFTTDIAKMVLEVFAVEDDILPLELTTIPANGDNRAMELSWNVLSEAQIFDALLWLYADADSGLTLTGGTLKNDGTTLASGSTLYKTTKKVFGNTVYYYPANAYVFGKMGFFELTGSPLTYANSLTRLGLSPGTASGDALRQYAYRWIDAQ